MIADVEATARVVENAKAPEDVFGSIEGSTVASRLRAVASRYRAIVQAIHPDRFIDDPVDFQRANAVLMRLTSWRTQAEDKIRAGTYGDRSAASPLPTPTPGPRVIRAPRRQYVVAETIASGDVADVYACTYQDEKKERSAVLKIAQNQADNGLLENESKTLSQLYQAGQAEVGFFRYLPMPIDSFVLKSPSGSLRRANVIQRAVGHVSLADVAAAYPTGLDFRDVAWMLKRALAAIGLVHRQGIVHGAILPPHVMVHPSGHSAKIVDWCYAAPVGSKVRALSKPYRDFYAPEIPGKKPVRASTDVYMLAKCAVALLGGHVPTNEVPASVPRPIHDFLRGCLLLAPGSRPDDAWALHEEFDELLLRIVGKPRYRELVMPPKGRAS